MGKRKAFLLILVALIAWATSAALSGSAQSPPAQVPPECAGISPAGAPLSPTEIADLPVLKYRNSDLPVWTQSRLTAAGQLAADGGMSIRVQGPPGTLEPGKMYKFTMEMALADGWKTADGAIGVPLEIMGQGWSGLSIIVSGDRVRLGEPELWIDGEVVGKAQRDAMLHVLPVEGARTGVGDYLGELSARLARTASPQFGGGRPTAGLRWDRPVDIRDSAQLVTTCFGGSASPDAMNWARHIVVMVPVAFDRNGRHTVTFVPDLRGGALVVGSRGPSSAMSSPAFEYRQQITVEFGVGRVAATPLLIFGGMLALLGAGLAVLLVSRQRRPRPATAVVQVVSEQGISKQAGMRQGRLTIGRDPRCEMVLSDPRASARHALIQQVPRGFVLTDLDSRNGTWVNGQRVQQVALRGGETLRVGQTDLRFAVTGGRAAPRAHPRPAGGAKAYVAIADEGQELARTAITSGTILGRHAGSPINLGADRQVSRQHAQFQYHEGQWWIRDMESRNGTFVNENRITVQRLQDGDQVRLGDTRLRFTVD